MLCYIAYPTSLTLQSANALQTYTTIRELRALRPSTLALIPRWQGGISRFEDVEALHLPRPAIGRLSRLYRSTLWYYMEYSLFAWMCVPLVAARKVSAIYVRQNICAAWWSGVFGPRLGIPVIYEAHDIELRNPSRAQEPWAEGFVHLIDRVALTRATKVVSLTYAFRDYLQQIGWRDPQDVAIIPDSYDNQVFMPQNKELCRAALGISPDAKIIAYAGMTFTRRWIDGLLDVIPALRTIYPTLQVILVGGRATEIERLKEYAELRGVTGMITFVGPRPQNSVVRYLGAADVLVIPDTVSDITASPLKLFEYLALGQPIVLPDLPALQEILPTDHGYYFSRGNRQELRQALQRALEVGEDTEGYAARRQIAREHTYHRRAERILACVDSLTELS